MEEIRPILIQGAMEVEIRYLIRSMPHFSQTEINGYIFHMCTLKDYPVIISETKIGSINSTIATTIGIVRYEPKIVINQGIAGAYGKDIHKFDVVFGTEVINTNSYMSQKRLEGEGSNSLDWELITFTSDDNKKQEEKRLEADKNLLSIAEKINYTKGKVHFGNIGSRRYVE